MPSGEVDLKRPKIRMKQDMIGIHVPFLNRTALIDAPTATDLGHALIREAERLSWAHTAANLDADIALADDDDPENDDLLKEEHRAFVFEAMMKRLKINPDDDLDLDEDYMEEDSD